ncbi:hypothetical protein EHS13_27210 [Paenibacillus psychroresistens]|uniref:Extracellular solute-binding protein n=1 Tax=Paenibacillus psychroresistens TaxID=1778678 RepID=A0A6B8RPL5_9BACL|nr:extracellular solute-binding protein [Paenibacillus psychroresistens]QGQ98311.1 hypothetical protein EHS13_27210 [Paenibacillus psychroresistens]
MRIGLKKMISVLIITCFMSTLLIACTKSKDESVVTSTPGASAEGSTTSAAPASPAASKLEPVTLNVMLWGDKPKQFDEVVAEFEKQTKDTLNTHLNVVWTPMADYVNKLKLKLAAGEQVDLAFDAPWMNMNQFIQQDNYYNLDEYFFNDKYPGLKKAFSDSFINNNKMMGIDQKLHTFGVPLGQYLGDLGILYYRKDLANKYGISDFKSEKDVEAYYDLVLKNEPNMIPFVERSDGNYNSDPVIQGDSSIMLAKADVNLWDVPIAPSIIATALIKDNKVLSASITGGKTADLQGFPAPFNQQNYDPLVAIRAWHDKGYTEKEPITRKDGAGTFAAGKAASMIEGISNYAKILGDLKAGVPTADLGMFVYQKGQREMTQPNAVTDFRAFNFLTIPKSSKNLERSMLFIDWLNQSQANHDFFELGIPGKNWEAVGEDKFKYPDGIDQGQNYNIPAYELTWNPTYIRLPNAIPDEYIKYYRYLADDKSYMKSATAGFAFNGDIVKNALANPDLGKVVSDSVLYKLGMIPNPAVEMAKLQAKWEKNTALQADLQKIKEEFVKQLQAFLDTQK